MIEDSVNDTDPMEQFIRLCSLKESAGVEKYGPVWAGMHPANEYLEEQLDSKNYVDRLYDMGAIGYFEYEYAVKMHFQLHWWMQNVIKRLV